MSRKTSIVVTTIFEPNWLNGYLRNIEEFNHKEDVCIHIICDKKTPDTVYSAAKQAGLQGFQIDCPSLDQQSIWLDKMGIPSDFIPWNTDNRRNIGFLRALERGCDVLISIDDDNYCPNDVDFIGCHHITGSTAQDTASLTTTGGVWFNACSRLTHDAQGVIYPRGFPYAERHVRNNQATVTRLSADSRRVVVNAGLWTDDPDVDAITRLALSPLVHTADPESVIMAPNTWCPINTQNTALLRNAMPAYYYVRMGYALRGMTIDRFGDILSGFFLQKCAYHIGDAVRFGAPVARHNRTQHNLLKDLYHELAGITLLEDLLPWLIEIKLSGNNYEEAYHSLADALASHAHLFRGFVWDDGGREFLVETSECMKLWLQIYKKFR